MPQRSYADRPVGGGRSAEKLAQVTRR